MVNQNKMYGKRPLTFNYPFYFKMLYLTSEIQKQFENIVDEVDWLSESTKDTARDKLGAMIHNIGYPDLVLNDTELSSEIEGVGN